MAVRQVRPALSPEGWFNVELYRVTQTARMDPRFFDSLTFEASGGVETTLTDSATQKDTTLREFLFFGFRWDFS
jgi:hypothetical protein